MLQEDFHAEVCQRRSKKHRRQLSFPHRLQVKFRTGPVQKFDLLQQLVSRPIADQLPQRRFLLHRNHLGFPLLGSLFRIGISIYSLLLPVVHTLEALAGTDGPVHRTGSNAQFLFNLVQQVKGIVGIPIQLVDKGKNRDPPHAADLEQLASLGLHALGSVDDHHCGVRRHQGTISILREVLMSRGIQNVYAKAVIFKL